MPADLVTATAEHTDVLAEMIYLAIYVPEGEDPPSRDLLNDPEIRRYFDGFGTDPDDLGTIALDAAVPIGACWSRCLPAGNPGYGWIAGDVPELSIALAPTHRRRGLGTQLLADHLAARRDQGVERVSLSVDHRSPAMRLYQRLGFVAVGSDDTSLTMVADLTG